MTMVTRAISFFIFFLFFGFLLDYNALSLSFLFLGENEIVVSGYHLKTR